MSIIKEKSFQFSITLVEALEKLDKKNAALLKKELFQAGTAIGLHVRQAQYAASKASFVMHFEAALQATAQTQYWLKLLVAVNYLPQEVFDSIFNETISMYKIIHSILATSKEKHLMN